MLHAEIICRRQAVARLLDICNAGSKIKRLNQPGHAEAANHT